ncbi:hypothetical protein NBRC3278_2624 [Acetobacter pasteurianus NBRC 3278]|uniref:Uncharacterized protein n=1 Tax=Acetobacter pasteurianus NBRC 3278 TaxID=1226660 RepID=A0A401X6K7_ACEPA|nr:hypothetical protein NBRC3278_2624 [Acetobacter pasteurianus NBRC 3278]GCD67199.1 hypothetical protein NBRC3279_2690 [Acetobacter pasteurianus NBRC 3279]GCD73515.1 hypothetical protein NBRC3284_2671 [Acetobacter pasteurianus NBRC 3284]
MLMDRNHLACTICIMNPMELMVLREPYGPPPVYNREGTIVKPTDSRNDTGREDYEHSPWATGASGGDQNAPPGTW